MFHYQQEKNGSNPIFFALCLLLRRCSGWMRCAARSLSPTVRKPSGSSKRRSTTPSLTTSTRARSAKFALSKTKNIKLSQVCNCSWGLWDHHWWISERKAVLAFLAGEWQLGFFFSLGWPKDKEMTCLDWDSDASMAGSSVFHPICVCSGSFVLFEAAISSLWDAS